MDGIREGNEKDFSGCRKDVLFMLNGTIKKKIAGMTSDFVRISYGESWDSSCEKSLVPVQNHWDSVQKTTSSELKKLGSLCDQAVTESDDRLQNSLSQFTEFKI